MVLGHPIHTGQRWGCLLKEGFGNIPWARDQIILLGRVTFLRCGWPWQRLIEAWNPLDKLGRQQRHLRVRKKQLERYGEPVEEANKIEYEDTMVTD